MRRLRKYFPFFKSSVMTITAYRFSIMMWLFITALQVVCIVCLWVGIYSSLAADAVVNGFTFKEMIMYTVMINIFSFTTFGGETMFTISEDIKNGTIVFSLMRPISYRIRFIFEILGSLFIEMLLFGLPAFIVSYIIFISIGFLVINNVFIFILHIVLFFIAQILSSLIYDAFSYFFGVWSFYTLSAWGLNQFKEAALKFLGGTLIPISFFPGVLKDILSYSPFAGLAQNPILIMLMMVDTLQALKLIGLSFAWWIVLEIIDYLFYHTAVKKVTVQGG